METHQTHATTRISEKDHTKKNTLTVQTGPNGWKAVGLPRNTAIPRNVARGGVRNGTVTGTSRTWTGFRAWAKNQGFTIVEEELEVQPKVKAKAKAKVTETPAAAPAPTPVIEAAPTAVTPPAVQPTATPPQRRMNFAETARLIATATGAEGIRMKDLVDRTAKTLGLDPLKVSDAIHAEVYRGAELKTGWVKIARGIFTFTQPAAKAA